MHPFEDPNGAPNKALFCLLLTSVYMHLKIILQRMRPIGLVTINSISRIFSSYTDCWPVLFKNRFCLSTGEDSTDCTAASRTHGLGFSPAYTERAVSYTSVPMRSTGMGHQYSATQSYHHWHGHTMLRVFPLGNKTS